MSADPEYSLYAEFASEWVRETVEKGDWDALRAEILLSAESFGKRLYRLIKQDYETRSGLWATHHGAVQQEIDHHAKHGRGT